MNTHPTKLILQDPDANEHTAALIAAQVGADKPTMIASTAWRADLPSALSEQSTTLIQKLSREAKIDYALLPADLQLHDFKLLVMDMDSTLITIECIDEIADMQGLKSEVAAITDAAASVMAATSDFKPCISAISSMHSMVIRVESISITSSLKSCSCRSAGSKA